MINSVSLFLNNWRDNADMSNVKEVIILLAEYERVIRKG